MTTVLAFAFPIALLAAGCGCNEFRTSTPRVTPAVDCLQFSASAHQGGSATCAYAKLEGKNGCSEPLVFPPEDVGTTTAVTVAPGAPFSVAPTKPRSASYPESYVVNAKLGEQSIRIEFEITEVP